MTNKMLMLSTDNTTIESLKTHNPDTMIEMASSLEEVMNTDAHVLIIDEQNPFSLSTSDISKMIRTKNNDVVIITLITSHLCSAKVDNLDAGADDCLTKPINPVEINARIRSILRRTSADYKPLTINYEYQFHDLHLDQGSRKCFIKNQEIALTSNEFTTLLHLVKNKGNLVSRNFLLKDIWQRDIDDSARPVDNVIGRLRKKLATHQSETEIISIWGQGYRIEA